MLRRVPNPRIYNVDTHLPGFEMVTTIQRWGNSLAVRIPKPFAIQAQLGEDTDVDITVEGDRIIIAPVKREWDLTELLARVTPSNQQHEVRWGEPKGKEVW